jgi:glutamyl/glutaminyl-tRNA synthetase
MLHLGNVVAFAAAWLSARVAGGRLLLRFEDIDRARARGDIQQAQRDDMRWLGFDWDEETQPQSARDYANGLRRLKPDCYRCQCSRKDRQATGGIYAGTCRDRGHTHGALRFRLRSVEERVKDRLYGELRVDPTRYGDPVLQRADGGVNYNLAVVVDDIRDGVSEVVRGADLLDYTAVQMQLWRALGHRPPSWLHAPLILGPDGKKLSKRHRSVSVADLRQQGWGPADVWRAVLPWLGLQGTALRPAVGNFCPQAILRGPIQLLDVPDRPGQMMWREHASASSA